MIFKNFIHPLKMFIKNPSMKDLLKIGINFIGQHTEMSEKDKAMIFHARKSLLFNDQQIWIQKEDGLLDVTMGGFNGAQVCETVGNIKRYCFIQGRWISNIYNSNF